ncbi:MAG: tRNA (adenosine(37)-N6)-dimethylallyltransferase MiaA, partial [Bdellovibrionales bacterium]|nr:tRNA (adenosine(37)-N6)-dimethylallyltransferase MiaA [Bdellovibrionales bacterium]
MMWPEVVVSGPTASGKSELAIALAEHVRGEVVCADSVQFYADHAIGSAAPSRSDMARVQHHLFGEIPGDQQFDA